MNRGELPGYYWDEEKKRYFKVQANHLVPDGAKYAKGSVNLDKRIAKKRKVDERKRINREKLSVKHSPVLSAPVGKIGLLREQQGFIRSHRVSEQCEAAVVAQWTPKFVRIELEDHRSRVKDAQYIPEREMMLVASASNNRATPIYARGWDWNAACNTPPGLGVAMLNANLSSISQRTDDCGTLIIASGTESSQPSIFVGILPFQNPDGTMNDERGAYLSLGSYQGCQDTAIHPEKETAATLGMGGIHLINIALTTTYAQLLPPEGDLDWPGCDTGISWLDHNTVLYGAKESSHSIMLWDTRTATGKTARFTIRDRLTSVSTPTQPGNSGYGSPHEILASTNYRISLFDVRMPRSGTTQRESPVLSFPHVHGEPRLQCAARGSLVAAVDRDNDVQVYSLRTGGKVAQLTTPPWQPRKLESPAFRKLSWYDDPQDGSVLHAVRGNGIVRWAWRGNEDQESDSDEG